MQLNEDIWILRERIDQLERALAKTERLLREEKKRKRHFWQRAA